MATRRRVAIPSVTRPVTGSTLEETRAVPLGPAILNHPDVLIAGRYVASRRLAHGLLGSTNQQVHLLTPRHCTAGFACLPNRELILHRDGSVTLSGAGPPRF